MGVQTFAEIEEISLRTPRPVATTEWPSSLLPPPLRFRAKNICWPKASDGCHRIGFVQEQSRFWTQLCRGI